jgi:hypothetical protein
MKKAGLAPAFCLPLACNMPAPAAPQQTVDGLQGALEIAARSSYVPSSPIGVRSAGCGGARLNAARPTRLEMPLWMK